MAQTIFQMDGIICQCQRETLIRGKRTKAMTDVKVEQCDINEAEEFRDILDSADAVYPSYAIDALAEILARHRQAAEKAQQERDAEIADAHRQARVEAAKNAHSRKVKAEARDHESMAIEALHIATAIRSQGHE